VLYCLVLAHPAIRSMKFRSQARWHVRLILTPLELLDLLAAPISDVQAVLMPVVSRDAKP